MCSARWDIKSVTVFQLTESYVYNCCTDAVTSAFHQRSILVHLCIVSLAGTSPCQLQTEQQLQSHMSSTTYELQHVLAPRTTWDQTAPRITRKKQKSYLTRHEGSMSSPFAHSHTLLVSVQQLASLQEATPQAVAMHGHLGVCSVAQVEEGGFHACWQTPAGGQHCH